MKPIKAETIYEFRYPSTLSVSPSEEDYFYLLGHADEEKNGYVNELYLDNELLDLKGNVTFAAWLDDSSFLYTLEAEDAQKGITELLRYDLNQKTSDSYANLPLSVSGIKRLNKNTLVILAEIDANTPDAYLYSEEERAASLKQMEEEQDYQVVDELPYYFNGKGFTNKKRTAVFVYQEENQTLKRVTDPLFQTYALKVEEGKAYFSGNSYSEKEPLTSALFVYDPATEEITQIYDGSELSIADFFFLNHQLYLNASDMKEYGINETGSFYKVNEDGLEKIGKIDRSLYESVANDIILRGGKGDFTSEGYLYSLVSDVDHVAIWKIGADLSHEELVRFPLIAFMDHRKDEILFAAATENSLLELYALNLRTLEVTQLSFHNRAITEEYAISLPEEISYHSNGADLNGWVLKPIGYKEGNLYPAVLDIHGGPRAIYTPVFFHEMQIWANMGYFVMFTNIHGSDGRGDGFADIRGKYGEIDYDDLMNFVDAVIDAYPEIDTHALFETGGSYGGFMSNWILTHTDRFSAIASQRSISNWVAFTYLSDIGPYFALDQNYVTDYIAQSGTLWKHSPLKYVDQAVTPILFIHSDEDYRCPLEEGMQLMQALKVRNVECRMVIFHKENHELSRSGKPKHRIRRLNEITGWFEQHRK